MDRFKNHGLNFALQSYRDVLNQKKSEFTSAMSAKLMTSSEAQFLLAFAERSPQTTEQPLTEYWKEVRNSRERAAVTEKYGHVPDDRIYRGSNADKEFQRRSRQVDDEVVPSRVDTDTTSWRARVSEYLSKQYREGMGRYRQEHPDKSINTSDLFFDGYFHIGTADTADDPANAYYHRMFIRSAYEIILPDSEADLDHDEPIEAVVRECAAEVARQIFSNSVYSRLNSITGKSCARSTEEMILATRQPVGEFIPHEQLMDAENASVSNAFRLHNVNGEHYAQGNSDIHTSRTLDNEQLRPTVATVEAANGGILRTSRLLQEDARTHELEPLNGSEKLVIRMNVPLSAASVPYIPGLKVVSQSEDGRIFGFEADEHDPYEPCATELNEYDRGRLAQAYDRIGLSDLALKVAADT